MSLWEAEGRGTTVVVTTELSTALLHEDDAQLFSPLLALLPRAPADILHCVLAHFKDSKVRCEMEPKSSFFQDCTLLGNALA